MAILKGVGDFFALDIGTTAVRVVQLAKAGNGMWSLRHYGYAPVTDNLVASSAPESRRKLGEIIMTAVGQSGIHTKDVVIGLPSNKTFTTVIDLPQMSESELRATLKYQADQYIPMPIDEAKVDWALLGKSLHDPSQQEVLMASTAADYSEDRLEYVESLGFNVVGIEPDPIAMTRSLLPDGVGDARMIVDVGEQSTDLVITYADAPRLVRTIPTGFKTLVRAATQNLGVQEDQARQFLLKFGLAPDRLDGQVYRSIELTLEGFGAELTKSIKFFQTRYPNIAIGATLLSGYASVMPMFPEFVTAKTSIQAFAANPWQKVQVGASDQQQLAAISHEFATVIGLAERVGK